MAIEYKDLLEMIISKPNLVIREYGTLNKQEPTINIGDPESLGIVAFENNPLYEILKYNLNPLKVILTPLGGIYEPKLSKF